MKSMTGFGRATGVIDGTDYSIEIKSVNHRYLDTRFRLPSFLSPLEIPLGKVIRSKFSRGSFDISIRYKAASTEKASNGTKFIVDESAAETLLAGYAFLKEKHQIDYPPPPAVFAMSGKVFIPVEETQDSTKLLEQLTPIFNEALDKLEQMRVGEGKAILEIIENGLSEIEKTIEKVKPLGVEQPRKIADSLKERIEKLQISTPVDAQRLEWEIAFYADKADFTEEIDRLEAHIKEFRSLINKPKSAIGRKLDFMTQEVNRELNTLGSKTAVLNITNLMVESKAQIEKLRQQIQNVE